MQISDKPQFSQLLKQTMGAYGKALPEAGIMAAWWETLAIYPLPVVARAMIEYCDENGEFAPVPAGIAKRCKLMDGRPGAEEAWAIAITSRDESDTVVWTAECAEAFTVCQSVLDMGNEIGARMAFKEVYTRIVTQARSEQRPVQWSASLGWDVTKRTAVLTKASSAGLLSAPSVAALLPPPVASATNDKAAQNQIAKIKEMMATMNAERQIEADLHEQRERDETAAAKARANELTANYKPRDAA